MGVYIDEARRERETASVNSISCRSGHRAHSRDRIAVHRDVAAEGSAAQAVINRNITNDDIVHKTFRCDVFAAQARAKRLYLMRWGWSASTPRRRFLSAS